MSPDPDHAAQKHDDEERNRPDDELDAAGIDEFRPVDRSRVGGAKPPGKSKGRDDRRDHNCEHDGDGVDEDRFVGAPDRALRIENALRTPLSQPPRSDAPTNKSNKNGRLNLWIVIASSHNETWPDLNVDLSQGPNLLSPGRAQ